MAICNKNQASVSQNHTNDFSQLSNKDDDLLSQEHIICQQHQIRRVLVEYYRPKQAPNLLFGQNLPASILT